MTCFRSHSGRLVLVIAITTLPFMGALTTLFAGSRESIESEPSGTSLAFTSDDPLIRSARRLIDQGKFTEAEQILRARDGGPRRVDEELLDIIQRIRVAYALDGAGLLARLRSSIPDVTPTDLDRWRDAGQVQYRMIDGKIAYFTREPANVFRFCDEAKRRRRTAPASRPAWTLEAHLARVIAEARRQGRAEVVPVRHRVRYSLTVHADAPHLKPGALVRVWLPFPQEYGRQTDVKLLDSSPRYNVLASPTMGEHPLSGAPQRTLYFEQRVTETGKPLVFQEEFEFKTSAYYPQLDDSRARPLPANRMGEDLAERPPHVIFTPQLKEAVAGIVGNESNPLARARRIFHFVATHIAYCAEEEYSTIPSLSSKALSSRRGDCGVQAILFITLCRAAGIPARWQSGWQTKREDCDMHDWAEFYVEPWGWLPADPSYGLRDSPDPQVREFYFGHQDSYRLVVNRDYGAALVPPKLSLRSEPLDFQRGEVEVDGHNLYFPSWDYDIDVQWLDEGP